MCSPNRPRDTFPEGRPGDSSQWTDSAARDVGAKAALGLPRGSSRHYHGSRQDDRE